MAKATLCLWHPLTQFYKRGIPLIKNTTSQNWHPTSMAPHKNDISQKWHLTKITSHKNSISKLTLLVFCSTIIGFLLIEPTATIRHKLKNLILKSHDHRPESCNKFKKFPFKNHSASGIFSQDVPFLWGTNFCGCCRFCLF